MKNILSIDAETNGLWGEAFAIAATYHDSTGTEIDSFIGRCPITAELDSFVEENVLPQMKSILDTHNEYEQLLGDFMNFYKTHKGDNTDIIVHMGLPVEARLFIDAHNMGILGDWDGPYPLIDISAFPEINTSVEDYIKSNELILPPCNDGCTHNPLYDCRATTIAYVHYKQNK